MRLHVVCHILIAIFSTTLSGSCPDHCESCACTKCHYGWWGADCNIPCSGCHVGGCDKVTGKCHQCPPGHHGAYCDRPCPQHCRGSSHGGAVHCYQDTGACLEGCVDSRWGHTCEKKCNRNCYGSACFQHDGSCVYDCHSGLYGKWCNETCPQHCSDKACNQFSGKCTKGCVDGWAGERCSHKCPQRCTSCSREEDCLSCKSGLYGPACMAECSENCLLMDCNANGICKEGCTDGFYGGKCTDVCVLHCQECQRWSGECVSCETGWNGSACLERYDVFEYQNSTFGYVPVNSSPIMYLTAWCKIIVVPVIYYILPPG